MYTLKTTRTLYTQYRAYTYVTITKPKYYSFRMGLAGITTYISEILDNGDYLCHFGDNRNYIIRKSTAKKIFCPKDLLTLHLLYT